MNNNNSLNNLEFSRSIIADQLEKVELEIKDLLDSDVPTVRQIIDYIIGSGGKRIRPMVALLSANACGYEGEHHIGCAAVAEIVHTATLLHDDVVDQSELRRGKETANQIWGSTACILVGDFMYARALEVGTRVDNLHIMKMICDASKVIAEAEINQLLNRGDATLTEDAYYGVIYGKTAKMFEMASRVGAALAEVPEPQELALSRYGAQIGMAFQLIDDAIDYTGTVDQIGKNIGDDLSEGKATMPLIYAMKHGSETEATLIRSAIEKQSCDNIEQIRKIVEATGAIEYTSRCAANEAQLAIDALDSLPHSPFKEGMVALAEFAAQRNF